MKERKKEGMDCEVCLSMYFITNENMKTAWLSYGKHRLSFPRTACTHCVAREKRWGHMGMWTFLLHGNIFPVMSHIDLNRYCRIWGTLAFSLLPIKIPSIHQDLFPWRLGWPLTLIKLIKPLPCPRPFTRRDSCKQVVATAWTSRTIRGV